MGQYFKFYHWGGGGRRNDQWGKTWSYDNVDIIVLPTFLYISVEYDYLTKCVGDCNICFYVNIGPIVMSYVMCEGL